MTSTPQKLPQAFNTNIVDLPLDRLLPSRAMFKGIETTRKYAQIKSSIQEIGLIEPVAITTADPKTGLHIILDGHLRVQVVRDLGIASITCLRAKDDEGYTYNKRVNRLATVQEHYMILRALERGVPEERLARVLDINMVSLHRKRNLLEGICPEVVDLLKDQHFGVDLMRHLRRMKPTRQIECTELMLSLGNFSSHYAAALLAATPGEQLIDPEKPKKFKGLTNHYRAYISRVNRAPTSKRAMALMSMALKSNAVSISEPRRLTGVACIKMPALKRSRIHNPEVIGITPHFPR
jgi:hypothetical protein